MKHIFKIDKRLGFRQLISEKTVLLFLLLIFTAYITFLAINLQTSIIPDETYRFTVSTYFADTWGIPDDVPIAYTSGDNLHRNPFLGYWMYGRIIGLTKTICPEANERQVLVILRLVNGLFAIGTVLITYLLSKELIQKKWWSLFPVFLLTNTLMFVFLSGGVNYDNPTILLCTLGILYLVRVFNNRPLFLNSIGWMISIFCATLIKYSILPLALIMLITWLIYLFKKRTEYSLEINLDLKSVVLLTLFVITIGFNVFIYGVNIIKFQSLTPACADTFPVDVCRNSFFGQRHERLALPEKLTVFTAFKQGYPEPIRYVFDEWIRLMLERIFGIMGEKNYFPINVTYFHIAFFWIIILGARYIKALPYKLTSMLIISIFYALILIWMNYNTELAYGFYKYVALQGRYIFPVISIIYILCTYTLTEVSNKWLKFTTLIVMIVLFLYSGPIRFLWYYQSIFTNWFI